MQKNLAEYFLCNKSEPSGPQICNEVSGESEFSGNTIASHFHLNSRPTWSIRQREQINIVPSKS